MRTTNQLYKSQTSSNLRLPISSDDRLDDDDVELEEGEIPEEAEETPAASPEPLVSQSITLYSTERGVLSVARFCNVFPCDLRGPAWQKVATV